MTNLLKKEFRLCLHPTSFIMLGLSALVLVPNYPYAVTFFYMTLSIYFVCLTSRENRDAVFTLCLPVSRKDMVRGRILMACCLEMTQLIVTALFLLLRRTIGGTENAAGLDANLALPGEGLILFGLFNLIFFSLWYKDIAKVGKPFLVASIVTFLYITLGVVSTYAVPFVRDGLDTPDPEHLTEKLLFLAAGAACYIVCTALAVRLSVNRFEQYDL